jgi:arylsulfatase A-like enzyme/Tfp pilus assembly protein PilF
MNAFASCQLLEKTFTVLTTLLLVSFAVAGTTPARRQTVPKANVLLITIDTLRADHLGCYGAKEVHTPTIDALARDSILYAHAISQVPLTWPSHAVILTGTYPFQNGVRDFTGQPLGPQFRSVAQAFKDHGYSTGAVVSAFVLDRSWGLARGFDFYDDAFSAEAFQKKDVGLVDRRAEESVRRAITWLGKNRQRPFFFWLHLYDPHSPYDPPEPFKTEYRDHPYDGEIAYTDHELGRLIEWLKQNRLYESTEIVLLSDHGESLGEHGEKEHGFFVYNATVHIPLIVKLSAVSKSKPTQISTPVETTAVAPTLLRSAGIADAIEKQFQSKALPEQQTDAIAGAYSETLYPYTSFGWSPLYALETDRYHYIDAPTPELYDLRADPSEINNLAATQSATVDAIRGKLLGVEQKKTETAVKAPPNSGLSSEAVQKLSSLGYVGYRAPNSNAPPPSGLPDPKSKLNEFNAILSASDAFRAGDIETGKQTLAHLAEEDPKMYIIPFMLGEASARTSSWDEATVQFRKSLELNPEFEEAMTGLARALFYRGNYSEARTWAQNALKHNPQNYRAWYELGTIDSKTDQQAAIADFNTGIAIQGNFAPLHRDVGILQLHQHKYREAAEHLSQAMDLGLETPELRNYLGICNSQNGQLRTAVTNYKRAIALDPNLAEAHLNLAYAYQQMNNLAGARPEYEDACRLDGKFCKFVPK